MTKQRAIAFLIMFLSFGSAHAGLIVLGTPIDERYQLSIAWGWDPEENSTSNPTLKYWQVELSVGPHVPTDLGGWTVNATHVFNPKDDPADPFLAVGLYADPNYGVLQDVTADIAHGTHTDIYHFVFFRSMDPSLTRITLDAVDVPEPGSLALLGLGLVGLGLSRRRKAT